MVETATPRTVRRVRSNLTLDQGARTPMQQTASSARRVVQPGMTPRAGSALGMASPALNGDGRSVISIKRPGSAARGSFDTRSSVRTNGMTSPAYSRPPSSLGGDGHHYVRPGSSLSSRSTMPMLGASGKGAENTVVSVRVRPPTASTLQKPWEYDGGEKYVRSVGHAHGPATDFSFDNVFTEHDDNQSVYEQSVKRLVQGVVDGYHGTVFAYGMTGTGKTYSMLGTPSNPGIIPLALQDVFDLVAGDQDNRYVLRASYLEIYNERIKDLLNTSSNEAEEIKIRDDPKRGIYAYPVTELPVTDLASFLTILERGDRIRHSAATDFNAHSSRSHAVVQIVIESTPAAMDVELSRTAGTAKISTLNLIDLAGSEKAASDSERRKEGAYINKSLLTLGTVIAKLTSSNGNGSLSHVPFRDSKLTRLLQNALSGLSLVSILATIHLDVRFVAETTNTLKFASRAKYIPAKAKRAELFGGDQALLVQSLRAEISMLRVQLFEAQSQVSKLTGAPMPALPPSGSALHGGRSISGESASMDMLLAGESPYDDLLTRISSLERDRTSGEDYIKHLEQRLGRYEDLQRTHVPNGTGSALALRRDQSPLSPLQQSSSAGNPMVTTPRTGENFSLPSRLSNGSRPATMAGSTAADISGLSPIRVGQLSADLVAEQAADVKLHEQDRALAQRVLHESQRSRDQIRDLSIKLDRFKRREEERLNTPTRTSAMASPSTMPTDFDSRQSGTRDSSLAPPVPLKDPPSPSVYSSMPTGSAGSAFGGDRPESERVYSAAIAANGYGSTSSIHSPAGQGFMSGMLRNLSTMGRSVGNGDKENSPPPSRGQAGAMGHSPVPSNHTGHSNGSNSNSAASGAGDGVFKGFKIKAGHLVHRGSTQPAKEETTATAAGRVVTVVSPRITAPRNENFI